jgi:hypothetical protein
MIAERCRRAPTPSRLPHQVSATLSRSSERLDRPTVARLRRQTGHDFRSVHIHRDEHAARALGARGYAAGEHVVLGSRSPLLLAHELAHVAQQRSAGPASADAEGRARRAAATVAAGGRVTAGQLGAAPPGLYRDEPATEEPRRELPRLTLSWDDVWRRRPPPSLGLPQLTLSGLPPLPVPATTPSPALTPPATTAAPAGPAPAAPSRLPVADVGRLSLGLRLGFPEAEELPNAPPSAAAAALQRAEVTAQMLSGHVPRGWEAVDKAKLASAVWGIFSTHIAPDVARRITSSLSRPARPGVTYQLDAVLLTDFSGGGLSFTVRTP